MHYLPIETTCISKIVGPKSGRSQKKSLGIISSSLVSTWTTQVVQKKKSLGIISSSLTE
jgi:hypothetical protein